ncbi:MAG: DPP IV N-terminal domain-containing protein [Flavobacteriales bacterium]|nr:DPP IV N-terminal domain-containing protein [Flavobacteriales bacterium]
MRKILLSVLVLSVSFIIHSQQKLTLEEAVMGQTGALLPDQPEQLQWLPQSDSYMYVKDAKVLYGTIKGKESVLFTLNDLNKWKGGDPLKEMPQLVWMDATRFWFVDTRRYFEGDIKNKTLVQTVPPADGALNNDYHAASRSLAYTIDKNIYAVIGGKMRQVTKVAKEIVAGQSISRNEYGIAKGTFWNADGSKLAFYQKDETNVTDYPITSFKDTPATAKMIKYPMAGAMSEIVSVCVYDVATSKIIFLDIDAGKRNDQYYATNLQWSADGEMIYIAKLNRATTEMKLVKYDVETGNELATLFAETDEKWLEPEQPMFFVPEPADQFLWFSRRNGFNNLYLYAADGKLISHTNAQFEITDIAGFDAKGTMVFVHARGHRPTESHLYKINLADMNMTLCTPATGMHNAKVSGSGKYILDSYSSLEVPGRTELLDNTGKLILTLHEAKNPLEGKLYGKTELFTIKADDGSDLWCRTIKPSDFDPAKKYPVLVYVYNGPHLQLVTNNWMGGSALWMNHLAEEGFIVFTLDGHGSANRGNAFEQVLHRQLGEQEIQDQLLGVDWLKKQPWVDAGRMAVHGWSYGGFMTTALMLREPGTFKVGVAGGAVTDWSLYEVMYTERYMDTPEENPEGYKKADLSQYVTNLRGDLLMIHGMDDDVVLMQHATKFLKACVDNNVQLDFFMYPGHAHNVRGKDRVHLMEKVIEYIKENL